MTNAIRKPRLSATDVLAMRDAIDPGVLDAIPELPADYPVADGPAAVMRLRDRLGPDGSTAERVNPAPRPPHGSLTVTVSLRIDEETLAAFKRGGRGHLTRMSDVLRAYAHELEVADR